MSGQSKGTPVPLPLTGPGGATPPWLVPTVMAVLERAGGSTFRIGADGLAALVTARSAAEFDVVLELTPTALTLRVWGLEREYPLPANDAAAASATAQRALADWLALLGGEARLVVYYRAGSACCWTVTARDRAPHPHSGWHPRRPPSRLVRWLRRWRQRVLANRFLEAGAVAELREQAGRGAAELQSARRAERGALGMLVPVAAA